MNDTARMVTSCVRGSPVTAASARAQLSAPERQRAERDSTKREVTHHAER